MILGVQEKSKLPFATFLRSQGIFIGNATEKEIGIFFAATQKKIPSHVPLVHGAGKIVVK